MSTTYSDIEDCLYRLTGPDMTYQTSLSVSALRRAIATVIEREVSAAIAAAVQAEQQRGDQRVLDEREACAVIAEKRSSGLTLAEINASKTTARAIAAAIRARGNGAK